MRHTIRTERVVNKSGKAGWRVVTDGVPSEAARPTERSARLEAEWERAEILRRYPAHTVVME